MKSDYEQLADYILNSNKDNFRRMRIVSELNSKINMLVAVMQEYGDKPINEIITLLEEELENVQKITG